MFKIWLPCEYYLKKKPAVKELRKTDQNLDLTKHIIYIYNKSQLK